MTFLAGFIKRATDQYDWESAVDYLNVIEQMYIFNETMININNYGDLPSMGWFIKNIIVAE